MVKDAAIAGLGVAWLPDHFVREPLEKGLLVQVLPEWTGPEGIVHLVFTTRRGLPSAVRAFIDHLAARWAGKRLHNRFYTLCVFCCYYEDFMKSRNVITKNLLHGLRQGTE